MSTVSVRPPEVHHARVNGVDLPYLDQGHGVPVVFVHGTTGDHRAWEDQREAVAERYRFIAPTQRYCGTGPWLDDGAGFSVSSHAEDLAAFIWQLHGGPAHVVGWSYGGAIGILLAVQHPEWVKSLFLFEPGLATFVTDPADAQLAGEDRKEMVRAPAAMAIEVGDTRARSRSSSME
jgi:pimeloyl-ACP methyl ester carboxylesterase